MDVTLKTAGNRGNRSCLYIKAVKTSGSERRNWDIKGPRFRDTEMWRYLEGQEDVARLKRP